jgi:hypothetical protein
MNVDLRKRHRKWKTETVMILSMKKLLQFCTNVYKFSPGRLKILRLKSRGVSTENTYVHLTGNKDRDEDQSSNC